MNLENMMLSERKQTQRLLYDPTSVKCPEWANPQIESRSEVARDSEEGVGEEWG